MTYVKTNHLPNALDMDGFKPFEVVGDDDIVEVSQQAIWEIAEMDKGAPVELEVDGHRLRLESEVVDKLVYLYRKV